MLQPKLISSSSKKKHPGTFITFEKISDYRQAICKSGYATHACTKLCMQPNGCLKTSVRRRYCPLLNVILLDISTITTAFINAYFDTEIINEQELKISVKSSH